MTKLPDAMMPLLPLGETHPTNSSHSVTRKVYSNANVLPGKLPLVVRHHLQVRHVCSNKAWELHVALQPWIHTIQSCIIHESCLQNNHNGCSSTVARLMTHGPWLTAHGSWYWWLMVLMAHGTDGSWYWWLKWPWLIWPMVLIAEWH